MMAAIDRGLHYSILGKSMSDRLVLARTSSVDNVLEIAVVIG